MTKESHALSLNLISSLSHSFNDGIIGCTICASGGGRVRIPAGRVEIVAPAGADNHHRPLLITRKVVPSSAVNLIVIFTAILVVAAVAAVSSCDAFSATPPPRPPSPIQKSSFRLDPTNTDSVPATATAEAASDIATRTIIRPQQQQQQQQQQNHHHHPIGFYVHIPYCRRRCRYCNFSIVPIGLGATSTNIPKDRPSSSALELESILEDQHQRSSSFDVIHQQYQADILAELDLVLLKQQQKPQDATHNNSVAAASSPSLSSIYFGGGTPSLAPVDMIQAILERILSTHFTLEPDAELTMEMDPGTFDLEQLQALKELGINRISLGVQSFDDTILESMGRVHRRADIFHSINLLHQVYGGSGSSGNDDDDKSSDVNYSNVNYSIDLISGVPGLTCAKWIETLETATALRPSHLSIYDLQVEEGTVFSNWYRSPSTTSTATTSTAATSNTSSKTTIPALPNEEEVAFMYKFGAGYLKSKGYEHYEVSSYARTPKLLRSRHNQIYWAPSSSWYAVGLGATSFVHGQMQARPKTLSDYHTWVMEQQQVQQQQQQQQVEDESVVIVSDEDLLTDLIMKRLRTSDGLDLDWVEERFGKEIRTTILQGATLGLELDMAEIVAVDGESVGGVTILRLKDPIGFLYSNYIISSIFAELGYE